MDRNQSKKLLPIIQAYSEGKTIQSRCIKGDTSLWYDDEDPSFDNDFEYRIKPESKYRHFKGAEECWQEMKKHQPFGWLKEEGKDNYRLVGTINNEGLFFVNHANNCKELSFLGANKWLTFADGVPFGVKVEES
jgi:hypothetical protein